MASTNKEEVMTSHSFLDADDNHPSNLRRFASNNTSQLAVIGSNLCPIESLDYEIMENELFNQDWRNRGRSHILQYVFMKWTFCFLIGCFVAVAGFVVNLAVENVSGFKFVSTSNFMFENK